MENFQQEKKNLLNRERWELTSLEWQKSRQTIPQQQNIYTSSPDINEKRFMSSQSIILIAIYAGRHPIDHNAAQNEKKKHTHTHNKINLNTTTYCLNKRDTT